MTIRTVSALAFAVLVALGAVGVTMPAKAWYRCTTSCIAGQCTTVCN